MYFVSNVCTAIILNVVRITSNSSSSVVTIAIQGRAEPSPLTLTGLRLRDNSTHTRRSRRGLPGTGGGISWGRGSAQGKLDGRMMEHDAAIVRLPGSAVIIHRQRQSMRRSLKNRYPRALPCARGSAPFVSGGPPHSPRCSSLRVSPPTASSIRPPWS